MQHECVIYNCDQCSYKEKTKGHVKQHVAMQHDGVLYNRNQCIQDFQEALLSKMLHIWGRYGARIFQKRGKYGAF